MRRRAHCRRPDRCRGLAAKVGFLPPRPPPSVRDARAALQTQNAPALPAAPCRLARCTRVQTASSCRAFAAPHLVANGNGRRWTR